MNPWKTKASIHPAANIALNQRSLRHITSVGARNRSPRAAPSRAALRRPNSGAAISCNISAQLLLALRLSDASTRVFDQLLVASLEQFDSDLVFLVDESVEVALVL